MNSDIIRFGSDIIRFGSDIIRFGSDIIRFGSDIIRFGSDMFRLGGNGINFASSMAGRASLEGRKTTLSRVSRPLTAKGTWVFFNEE